MKTKKCLNCNKKLISKHYTAKFCNFECGKEFRKKNRIKNEIRDMKIKCSYDGCKDIARCMINGKFLCIEHFKIVKSELKHNLYLNCLNCGRQAKKSKYTHNQKFCSFECRIAFRNKIKEIRNAARNK